MYGYYSIPGRLSILRQNAYPENFLGFAESWECPGRSFCNLKISLNKLRPYNFQELNMGQEVFFKDTHCPKRCSLSESFPIVIRSRLQTQPIHLWAIVSELGKMKLSSFSPKSTDREIRIPFFLVFLKRRVWKFEENYWRTARGSSDEKEDQGVKDAGSRFR